ncbi:hypothetical protein [Stenotrophomonas sp.]|uniref:hypothetical protein n=1 Tax=Stenotrophomonas sp. TaxID=69392 RepID=UPI002FCB4B7C
MPSRYAPLWMWCLLLWTLAVLPAAAAARSSPPPPVQQIHKCRVEGVATFQRHACAPGQAEQAWEVDVVPAERRHAARIEAIRRELQASKEALEARRAPPVQQRRPRATRRDGVAPRRRARAPPGAVISLHQQPRACAAARREQAAAYARAGSRRGFALSRRMDDRVQAACR